MANPLSELSSKLPAKLASSLPTRLGGVAGQVIPVVRLHGVIASGAGGLGRPLLNLDAVEESLTKAFTTDGAQVVALSINSPGGSPTQSALMGDRIRQLAAEHEVGVVAFCEDVAASGGYWLACAADEIVATSTSLLGSVGVISAGFGLEGLIDKLGVERRLHTQGANKSRLDPFSPEKDEDVAWLLGMQESIHAEFKAWVRSRRPALVGTDDELFTGEAWTGRRAVELGVADTVGTLRGVLGERFPDAEIKSVSKRNPLAARLGLPGAAVSAIADGLLGAVADRAAWARFGL